MSPFLSSINSYCLLDDLEMDTNHTHAWKTNILSFFVDIGLFRTIKLIVDNDSDRNNSIPNFTLPAEKVIRVNTPFYPIPHADTDGAAIAV